MGHSAGLTLHLDRIGITYGSGPALGDPASPVQVSAVVRGDRPVPARAVPEVVARIGVRPDPGGDARSVREQEIAGLDSVVAADPPLLLSGDAVALLPDAVARVPAGALPVVITAWALSSFPPEKRLRFLHRLGDVAAGRAVAWVSVEGVGVAPAVPTLGDRLASGHSIVGVAVFDGSAFTVEAVGRCWSRGRWLSWLL